MWHLSKAKISPFYPPTADLLFSQRYAVLVTFAMAMLKLQKKMKKIESFASILCPLLCPPCPLFIYILWKPLIYSTNKGMKNFLSKTIKKVFLILGSCILFCRQKNWLWTYLRARISYLGETRICKSRVARENRSGEIGCPRHFTAFFSGRLPRKIGSWFLSMRTGWKLEKKKQSS